MTSFRFHPEADEDYLTAAKWYLAISVRVAIRFVQTVENAIQKIRTMPQAYPRYDRRHRAFVLSRFPYYIVYREETDGVTVVAVAQNSRRPRYW